jgi:class 3 adenylate cyclase
MTDLKDSALRVTKILLRAQDDPDLLRELEQFRRYLVVMFTDIQGSTAYFEKHGDAAGLFMVRQCNDIIRGFVQQYGGNLIKTIGDGSMATFPEIEGAVQAAVEIQRTLKRSKSLNSASNQIEVRIGIHAGTGIVSTNDVFGDVVNVAARVESAAKPRQILLSEEACLNLRDFRASIQKLGPFKLKGKSEERTLFEVNWDQDSSGETQFGPPMEPDSSDLDLKLQILSKSGDVLAQYPIQPELGIRISPGGEVGVSSDARKETVLGQPYSFACQAPMFSTAATCFWPEHKYSDTKKSNQLSPGPVEQRLGPYPIWFLRQTWSVCAESIPMAIPSLVIRLPRTSFNSAVHAGNTFFRKTVS